MKKYLSISLPVLFAFLIISAYATNGDVKIDLGNYDKEQLQQIISISANFKNEGEKIDYISSKFLGVPYEENTLTGGLETREIFTINLAGMDCFTYLDYVEALRISLNVDDFDDHLKSVRYRGSMVGFKNRNHFFSDWIIYNKDRIKDVTKEIGGDKTRSVLKQLNKKSNGDLYLPGIRVVEREIYYIPSEEIDEKILNNLRDGDYVGIYTDTHGLDVSHTGLIVKNKDKILLRHASSKEIYSKVIEEDLINYIKNKAGIVIYRVI